MVAIVTALLFSVYIPFVQHFIVNKLETTIGESLDADVKIGFFDLSFFADINLDNIEISKQGDTLLLLKKLKLDVAFKPLLNHNIVINDLQLNGMYTQLDKLIAYNDTTSVEQVGADNSEEWNVKVNHISIAQSKLSLYDAELDMNLQIDVGQAEIGELSIDSFVYDVQDIVLQNSRVSYVSPFTMEVDTDSSVTDFILTSNKVLFLNSEFYYNDSLMTFSVGGRNVEAENLYVNVATETVKMTKAEMSNSYFNFVYINDTLETPESDNLWKVYVDRGIIRESKFIYDIPYLVEIPDEFDYNHLHFTDLNAEVNNIFYSEPKISLELIAGSFNENNKVDIIQSSGGLLIDNQKLALSKLKVKTANSDIAIDGSMGYNVKDFDFRDNGLLDLQIDYSGRKWDDLDYFMAEEVAMIPNLSQVRNKEVKLKARVSGYYDDLKLVFDAQYDTNTKLIGKASVKNATQKQGLEYQVDVADFEITRKTLALFIDDKSALEYVPQKSVFKGKIKGSDNKVEVDGNYVSDYGSQKVGALLDFSANTTEVIANIEGEVNGADIYDFKVDSALLKLNIKANDLESLVANADLVLKGIQIDTVFYDSLISHFEIEKQAYQMNFYSYDEHADFSIVSQGTLNDSVVDSHTELEVNNFSFAKNNIFTSPENMEFKSKLDLRFNINSYHTHFNGVFNDIALSDSLYTNKVKKLRVFFNHNDKNTAFSFVSDHNTLKAEVNGSVDTLINNFQKFVEVLVLEKEREVGDTLFFPDVTLYADIQDPYEFVGHELSDSIPQFSSLNINAEYREKKHEFNVDVFIPQLTYANSILDSSSLKLKGNLQGFDYAFQSSLLLDSILDVKLLLDGDFKERKLKTHLNIRDNNNVDFIDFEILSQQADAGYVLSILGDTLTILSNRWHINQPNSLELKKDDIVANNIALNRADKQIRIESNSADKDISLILKNIELAVFNQVLSNDSLLAGYANLELTTSFQHEVSRVNLVANIDSFRYENYYLGDIDIPKAHLDEKQLDFYASLENPLGKSVLGGVIEFNAEQNLDIKMDINSLDMDFMNTYMSDYLYNVKGRFNAKLNISGSLNSPDINGFMYFDNTHFGLVDLREEYSVNDEKIYFTHNKLDPSRLLISDVNKHKVYFQGDLLLSDYQLMFDKFHIKSDEFELMNATREDNELINGTIVSNFDIRLDGFLDDLNAKSKVELDYPTVINYTFPEDLSVASSDGIVHFGKIDTTEILDSVLIKSMENKQSHLMDIFRKLDAELTVKEGCKFNIYFDNSLENNVHLIVDGDIKYLFSDKNVNTSGLLNIKKGKMNYSMPMVSMKELEVKDDSYIQITNDISNPYVSINAISKIWAQTGDLVENYNRNLEVTVFVYMRGTLDNLIVQFDVSPQTTDALISSKISQMSEKERTMNAVNLLIRGQFASKQNTMTIDINSYVNSLIASGLNKLISDRVKFVDMSFDIKSFNNIKSNGAVETQSNLFFNVGKSFYHDRIRVNYRSNMTSSVTQQAGQYGSTDSYTESNFSIEYDINKRGDFKAVLFRKDSYEDILEGDIISTGGGLQIRKSYKSFGDIFKVKKKQ